MMRDRLRSRTLLNVAVVLLALAVAGQQPSPKPATPTANEQLACGLTRWPMVVLPVTVTAKYGRPNPSLTEAAFSVTDEKVPSRLAAFRRYDDPASIAILLDVSVSIKDFRNRTDLFKEIARFVRLPEPRDYCLFTFNGSVNEVSDWTTEPGQIESVLSHIPQPRGYPALRDALDAGLSKLQSAKNSKHVIIVVTAGDDIASHKTVDQIRRALKESDVLVYSIGSWALPERDSLDDHRNFPLEITRITGGAAFFPESVKQLSAAFDLIDAQLHGQYLVGFYTAASERDGKWHNVKISARRPTVPGKPVEADLEVRARPGYYAPRP